MISTDFKDIAGFVAAFLTTAAFLPQAYHSWKTRDLSGISLSMYSMFTLGVAGWLIYGLMINSLPVIVANAITLVLSSIVLYLKIDLKIVLKIKSAKNLPKD